MVLRDKRDAGKKVSFRAQDEGKWTSQKYRILNCECVKHATGEEDRAVMR